MTAKYNKYDYKDLLLEVDLTDESGELSDMLNELDSSPAKYGRVEAPAGYENQLMAALKMRLPLDAKIASKTTATEAKPGFLSAYMASAKMAWSFSGVMAIFVAVMAFQSIRNSEQNFNEDSHDFLAQTAQRGSSEAVERWLASVSDLGVQALEDSPSGVVSELAAMDPARAKQALRDVAQSLGYKEEI